MSSLHHARHHPAPFHSRKQTLRAKGVAPLAKSAGSAKVVVFKGTNRARPTEDEDKSNDDFTSEGNDEMATSFLQFCAMCERQILDAESSICDPYLDLGHPTSGADIGDEILRAKFPALATPKQHNFRPSAAARIPPIAHEGKSDLDPTEWKPKLAHRPSSDARRFLSQFHSSESNLANLRRHPATHSRSAGSFPMAAPSLSATPTTSTSSGDSVAGTPYEFNGQDLLPQHNPLYSSLASTADSMDFGTPHAPLALSVPAEGPAVSRKSAVCVGERDLDYKEKFSRSSMGPATGNLTTLLDAARLDSNAAM
ncbi:MAG: hypothetical protein Q9190_006579 [Brigantiaea leucoxantha]